jgi:hypothetical protein
MKIFLVLWIIFPGNGRTQIAAFYGPSMSSATLNCNILKDDYHRHGYEAWCEQPK